MSLPERVYTSNNHKQLSLFNDRLASEDDLREAVQKLSAAFPVPAAEQKSAAMFFAVLVERLRDNKFTGERLRAAVNHVIDNFRYKQINIADVVNFDRAARLYTCADYNAARPSELDDFAPMYDDKLQPVRIGGVAYMIRISENPDSILSRRALAARRLQQNRREVDEECENVLRMLVADVFHEQPGIELSEARRIANERFEKSDKYKELKNKYYEIPRDVQL